MAEPETPEGGERAARRCAECLLIPEAEHRISNHLTLLSSYARTRARAMGNPEGRLALDTVALQIEAVGRLHRLLMRGEGSSADIGEQLSHAAESFVDALGASVIVEQHIEAGCRIPYNHVLPATQIVVEAMTNALKHAATPQGDVHISLRCARRGDAITVSVSDNGPGMQGPEAQRRSGLRMMDGLARQAGAVLTIRSHQGVEVVLELQAMEG